MTPYPPLAEGTTKLEYDPVTDMWKAYGYVNKKWTLISTSAYGTANGAKLDMWYKMAINHFRSSFGRNQNANRTAAQATYGHTSGQSINPTGGAVSTSTSIPITVVASGGSGGSAGYAGTGAAINTVTGTVTTPGMIIAGASQYHPNSGFAGGGTGIVQTSPNQISQHRLTQWIIAAGSTVDPRANVEIPKGDTKFGEIVAWRAWRLGPQGLLVSMAMDTFWIPGEPMTGDPTTGHGGVYAWKTREAAIEYAHPPYRVIGEVYLYGTVDEYEHGYRSEYATIKSLDVIDDLAAVAIAKPDVLKMCTDLRARYIKVKVPE